MSYPSATDITNQQKPEIGSLNVSDTGSAQKDSSVFDLNYITGRFDPSDHPAFMEIPSLYRDEQERYIRRDVFDAFKRMYDAALKDGVRLRIISATRNFDSQKRIWENKWTGKTRIESGTDASKAFPVPRERALKILEYSSMPGTSRHHWGTDLDFNALNNSWFEKGEGLKIYQWLVAHAPLYGFCQPYTTFGVDRFAGYQEEKWHWTFVPVAAEIQKKAQELLKNEDITGFSGAETAVEIDVVGRYVSGIHPDCFPFN
jgi:LAS superfamily LD-carboxypeptidase LdcB